MKIIQSPSLFRLQRVPRGYLENFQIPLPPLEVQKEIVAEIESYQAEITQFKNAITGKEKNIQATVARVWGEETEGGPP